MRPCLESFAKQRFGGVVVTAGWRDFSRWGIATLAHEKDNYQSVFLSWWLFAWLPDDEGLAEGAFLVEAPDHAIAKVYLTTYRDRLSHLEQRVIERALISPYSFYAVQSIESCNRLRLQDIYTQKQVLVDVANTELYIHGEILFCAVLTVDGISILLGCMPQALDKVHRERIDTHRQKWRADVGRAIDRRQLYLHDTELRRYFFLLLSQQQQAIMH